MEKENGKIPNKNFKEQQYLSAYLLKEIYNEIGCSDKEEAEINSLLKVLVGNINEKQKTDIERKAEVILSALGDDILHRFEDEYDDGWERPPIYYNEEFKNIWMNGVRNRISVAMEYESETSGRAKRIVDPYSTSGAYGKGYCHLRRDERKFRFDRVLDIGLTSKKFVK